MPHGWMGTDLEVDLSSGKIEKVPFEPRLAEAYIAGKGTNAKILWDRVPPEVAPFSPDNLLIVGTGALAGTPVPGANRATFTFKSPVTNLHSYSNIGGFFAPELKHAGYDTIVISGKSPTPVYLWINDDHAEIRNASHLWGKDTHETQRLIREELGIDKVQTVCIGPAGENKVYAASIEHSTGATASRGGVGAIMGDKNLKAIAVYGTKDIAIAKPTRLIELSQQILDNSDQVITQVFEVFGRRNVQAYVRGGAYGNFTGAISPEFQQKINGTGEMVQEFIEKTRVRQVSCYNCAFRCKQTYLRPDGGYSFIKCMSWGIPMITSKIIDCDFALTFYNLCEKYGLDTFSVGNGIGFAIDLYERGILTKEDADGMHLGWENAEVSLSLVEKIARREGIGDVLANGVYEAARQIGKGAEQYCFHVKKQELLPFKVRGCHDALIHAINDKPDLVRMLNGMFGRIWPRSREEREAYIKSGFFGYPREFDKYLLADFDYGGDDYEGICQFTAYDEETFTLADVTGLCYFWVRHYEWSPINSRPLIADLISCVTGMDIDEIGATRIARRVISLARAYNVREGIRRTDDRLPELLFHSAATPPYPKLDHSLFNKWIDRWYEIKGWNSEGIPTEETLQELDLDYVRQDLRQRGILTS